MDILGIGPLELVFVLLIALIIFGPKDIVKAGRSVGHFLRTVVKSDGWKAFQEASKGMRNLPNTLMREAGIEEEELKNMTGMTDLEKTTKDLDNQIAPWTTPPLKKVDQQKISEETSTSDAEFPPTDASEEISPPSNDN